MNTLRATHALTLAAALVLGGCGGAAVRENPFQRSGSSANSVTLRITNLNFNQATIFGMVTGGRQRLGVVEGGREAVLSLRLSTPSELYLEINFLAGPLCFTERIQVDPGDQLEITLQQGGSNLACRARS